MTSATGRLATLALAMGIVGLASRADATPITYTEIVTASGSLGGTAYTNALVTLIATGDTTGIVSTGPITLATPVSVTVTITAAGLDGPFTFTDPYVVFRSGGLAGIARGTPAARGSDLLNVTNSVFNTYDLATSIGPISGTPSFNATTGFATNAGTFFINSVAGNATFQAALQATPIPEPSSLALLAMGGLVAMRGLGKKRLRRVA